MAEERTPEEEEKGRERTEGGWKKGTRGRNETVRESVERGEEATKRRSPPSAVCFLPLLPMPGRRGQGLGRFALKPKTVRRSEISVIN